MYRLTTLLIRLYVYCYQTHVYIFIVSKSTYAFLFGCVLLYRNRSRSFTLRFCAKKFKIFYSKGVLKALKVQSFSYSKILKAQREFLTLVKTSTYFILRSGLKEKLVSLKSHIWNLYYLHCIRSEQFYMKHSLARKKIKCIETSECRECQELNT